MFSKYDDSTVFLFSFIGHSLGTALVFFSFIDNSSHNSIKQQTKTTKLMNYLIKGASLVAAASNFCTKSQIYGRE